LVLTRFLTRNNAFFLCGTALLGVLAGYYYQQPDACQVASEGKTAVRVSGLSWDADSSGFAFYQGLSKTEGKKKAGRTNSRIYVDGQPERYAITKSGPEFQIEFETDQPTFQLISEGDGFPQTISQPYQIPTNGCDIDVERLNAPRAEGPEHSWPLPMVASKMSYKSWKELMADNNAVIRLLTYGSGEEGAPDFTDKTVIATKGAEVSVHPFDMDTKITFLQLMDENSGGFMLVVPFSADEPADKKITVLVTDTVTEANWNPPRPWKFDPATIFVRNGFATDVRLSPSADQ
jgi:hypothetical protein